MMLEHAIYSVISPEGAASILWRDTARAQDAATGMKITAQDLLKFGIIDRIVSEPTGGAHRDREAVITNVREQLYTISKNKLVMEKVEAGQLLVVGGFYEITSGMVDFIDCDGQEPGLLASKA